jgi:hypothetical protein
LFRWASIKTFDMAGIVGIEDHFPFKMLHETFLLCDVQRIIKIKINIQIIN